MLTYLLTCRLARLHCVRRVVLRGSDVTRYEGRRVLLGWGHARMTRREMFREAKGLAVEVRRRAPPVQDAPSMNRLCEGVIRLQNFPSILVGHVLAPQPGEAVLDMCAAPGGKTAHLAALMQCTGESINQTVAVGGGSGGGGGSSDDCQFYSNS